MSINPIVVNSTTTDIESGIVQLIHKQPNYESYVISDSCGFTQFQVTKEEVKKISRIIHSSVDNQYDQLKLIIDHNKIIVYPHIGSA